MKKYLLSMAVLLGALNLYAQNVGIGTNQPKVRLHVVDSSVVFSASGPPFDNPAPLPLPTVGRRMMWYADKAAFRVGYLSFDGSGFWDKNLLGDASISGGFNTRASGDYSVSLGYANNASGFGSLALGGTSTASGILAVAIGSGSWASGDYSVCLGSRVSTNGKRGAMFLGDGDPHNNGTRSIGFDDQLAARFNGGYYFISSDAGADIGVRVLAGGNSWSAISDVRLKENFLPVDGESVLRKIAGFKSVSWNYKGQDAKTFRHYGPMAQEFFAAFGKDDLGTIGCDTLINQHDFLGVNLIAIQALEKRTTTLQTENEQLKKKNEELEARLQRLETLLAAKQ